MKLYAIADWNARYENSRSRQYARLGFVLVPNKFDGEHFLGIMRHIDGAMIFAAFILMIEVASTCQPRGTLVRSNGEPHTPETLASKTRAPVGWFVRALAFLEKETDWLVVKAVKGKSPMKEPICTGPVQGLYTEQNRTEQNRCTEQNRKEGEGLYISSPSVRGAPDLKTVQGWAGMMAIPATEAEQFWHVFEAVGWRDRNGNLIVSARSKLASWWADRRQRLGDKPAVGVSPAQLIAFQKELERVEARIKWLRDANGKGKWEEKPRLELVKLKARCAELIKLLGFAV